MFLKFHKDAAKTLFNLKVVSDAKTELCYLN